MVFYDPGNIFFAIVAVSLLSVLGYTVYQRLSPTAPNGISVAMGPLERTDIDRASWDVTLLNTGPAAARNVTVSVRAFDDDRVPLAAPTVVGETDRWAPDTALVVPYTIEHPETTYLQFVVETYRFEEHLWVRQTALGDLVAADRRVR
jgi:hypothetical protein